MRRAGLIGLLALVLAVPLQGQEAFAVPSGQPITFYDHLMSTPDAENPAQSLTARFRFLAPMIGQGEAQFDFFASIEDMAYLCEVYALPRLPKTGPEVSQIVISLMNAPAEFGSASPDVTQFFESYRPVGASCEWQEF